MESNRPSPPALIAMLVVFATTACNDVPQSAAVEQQTHSLSGPTLSVTIDNENSLIPIREGATVSIADTPFTVDAIRPWSGLVRTGGGLPMAAVSICVNDDTWIENIFLADGVWTVAGDNVSLVLHWHDSNDAARAAANAPHDPVAGARWGVRDGGRIQWLNSFEPGAGVEIHDGTAVSLLALGRQADQPALELSVRRAETERREIVTPNHDADALLLFEVPGLREYVIRLHAWRDGTAYVNIHRSGEPSAAPGELSDSETWTLGDGSTSIRLEQAMRHAAAAMEADSTIHEAVLQNEHDRIRVREGEAVRHGDALLRFHDPS